MRERALELAEGLAPTPKNLTRVARETSEEAARWAFAQWALRKRASARFPNAETWFWDEEGLAMATHPVLARYHASFFPDGAPVVDLTAGLGADLAALAARGPALGIERDPVRARLCANNVPSSTIVVGDGLLCVGAAPFLLADPQRRSAAGRARNPEDWSPSPWAVAARMRAAERGVMTLSPGTPDEVLRELGGRVEFVSFGGECREALVIFGDSGPPWQAVRLDSGERLDAGSGEPETETPGSWLYDFDPAFVRAGFRALPGVSSLGDAPGYGTAETPDLAGGWARVYRVLWSGRLDAAPRAARDLGVRPEELKQRGAGLDPARELRRFRGEGRAVSLVAYRVGPSVRGALAERKGR